MLLGPFCRPLKSVVSNGFERLVFNNLRLLGFGSVKVILGSASSSSHSQWVQLDLLYCAMICIDVALEAMTGSSLEISQLGHGPGRTYVKISVSMPLHLCCISVIQRSFFLDFGSHNQRFYVESGHPLNINGSGRFIEL